MTVRTGLAAGDRVLFLGLGPRNRHGDVVYVMPRGFASVRFDHGRPVLTLVKDLHPIPRRPPEMW
jgi:hypothetical protein